jgi:hypothetical protein
MINLMVRLSLYPFFIIVIGLFVYFGFRNMIKYLLKILVYYLFIFFGKIIWVNISL